MRWNLDCDPWVSRSFFYQNFVTTNTVIYIYIYIYIYISSSSCRTASTDIPDPLSPLLPIIHRLRQVFRVTSCVLTLLLYVSSCWSSCFCSSICGGPQEYLAYELVLASPAVSCVSGSSNLYRFRDGGASVRIVGVLWGVVARTYSILLSTFLCNFRLVSSPAA